jgi:hypothetical protein
MKLLTKVGDAMLAKLIPGIDAAANCGQCRFSHRVCDCLMADGFLHLRTISIDLCGRVCSRCLRDSLYICN